MFDILSRAVYESGEKINESVVYVKQNKSICHEICQEIHYLSSLLQEIENKIQVLSPATHDTLVRYLPLMKKGYDEALEYIDSHINVGHIKKFYTSKSTKYHLENVIRNLSRIKQTLTSALVDDLVDPIVLSTPIPSTVGIEKHVESMLLAFTTLHFLQSLQIAKEVSKKIPQDDKLAKAGIHYDMACIYSMLFNPRSVVFHLQSAKACGFSDFKEIDEDHDFDNVRYHLEFINFRQNMEYEVLQTDKWRELSEKAVNKLTSLFNCYDQSGNGVLGFTQFHALCADSFPATTPAQVMSFFQETCEDTIESMNLTEFLNFMVEHPALLNKVVPNVSIQHYNSFSPIFTSSHFFPLSSPTKSFEVQPNYVTHHYYQNNITFQPIISSLSSLSPLSSIPFFSNAVDFSSQQEGNIRRGQDCGWLEDVNQPQVACQQKITSQSVYVTDHFSYYTTTDPLASFRC